MVSEEIFTRLQNAFEARRPLLDAGHEQALRLFNGFYEGCPDLVVDLYARTLVLFCYADDEETREIFLDAVRSFLLERLPWVECVIQKYRNARQPAHRSGVVTYGDRPSTAVRENGIWFAVDLLMNQDASFYLDTRNLRQWLHENLAGKSLLNTFAYTGSLGVAALSGGAERVVQVDRNRDFLALARRSAMLNRLDLGKMKLVANDFFSHVAYLKHSGELFDGAIVDPPIFSATDKGIVNLVSESQRVINKVRPLIKDGGWLVAINNALFLSGSEYLQMLEKLCADGYLAIETLLPIPQDVTGFPHTIVAPPPSDPAPFNHPTKIAILRTRRKG